MRENLWPPTEEFLGSVSPCILGDLGCGTGRGVIRALELGCEVLAVDSSGGQLDEARRGVEGSGLVDNVNFIQSDLESVPLNDGSLDNSLMIAVLHHLPTRETRIKVLREAGRLVRPGGKIQVSVWTWDQERFRSRHLTRIGGDREMNDLDGPHVGDFYVPWKEGKMGNRFYHLYGHGELEKELSISGWRVLRSYFDGRNHWCESVSGSG